MGTQLSSKPSDVVRIKGPCQQVQVPDVGGLEELGPVHHRDGDTQGCPDVGRHLLVAAVLTPPLLVQSRQEVGDCLPAGPGPVQTMKIRSAVGMMSDLTGLCNILF